jgi:hypothetical protein
MEAQAWIFLTQMAEEIRSGSQHDALVCDRSVLDNYAYLVKHLVLNHPKGQKRLI